MFNLLIAEMGRARRRRAVWDLALIMLLVLGVYSWSNHKEAGDYRARIVDVESFLKSVQRNQRVLPQDIRQAFQEEVDSKRDDLEKRRKQLSPSRSHHYVLSFFGTAIGMLISIVLAATLVGAEFRWGYWKTLASHEPRRGRLVVAKVVTIWIFILIGLALLLGVSYPLNGLFARVYDVRPHGGIPLALNVMNDFWRAWLTNCVYATVAAAIVFLTGSNIAGSTGAAAILFAEGRLSTDVAAIRRGSLAQQVEALFPKPPLGVSNDVPGAQWFGPPTSLRILVENELGHLSEVARLKPIPEWQALIVLLAWIALFLTIAVVAMRRRDLPP